MSYNNSVTINDCITELQTINDFKEEIDRLEDFLHSATLQDDDKEILKKLFTRLLTKNTVQATKIIKVANKLNKLGYY